MSNQLSQKLQTLSPQVNAAIAKIIQSELDRCSTHTAEVTDFINHIEKLTVGGKRLRAALTYYSYLMFGGSPSPQIIDAAAVIELIHAYLLIHDDIMDRDDVRRGSRTVHSTYRNIHSNAGMIGQPEHFGVSIGILAGDALAHTALAHFSKLKFPSSKLNKATAMLHSHLVDTAYGQLYDVFSTTRNNYCIHEVYRISHYKTAVYTYLNPICIGGSLAGAKQSQLKQIEEYAIPAGIAFQIQDDILGTFGDEQKLGKPADSDLKEGKKTLLTVKALELANKKDHNRIVNVLGNRAATSNQIIQVRQIIKDCGAYDFAVQKAKEYVDAAITSLDTMPGEPMGKQFLSDLAVAMINREL